MDPKKKTSRAFGLLFFIDGQLIVDPRKQPLQEVWEVVTYVTGEGTENRNFREFA